VSGQQEAGASLRRGVSVQASTKTQDRFPEDIDSGRSWQGNHATTRSCLADHHFTTMRLPLRAHPGRRSGRGSSSPRATTSSVAGRPRADRTSPGAATSRPCLAPRMNLSTSSMSSRSRSSTMVPVRGATICRTAVREGRNNLPEILAWQDEPELNVLCNPDGSIVGRDARASRTLLAAGRSARAQASCRLVTVPSGAWVTSSRRWPSRS
jgi:hypothetical protein